MQYGLKHIPDTALSIVIPHLEAMFPVKTIDQPVHPENAPELSFEAGQQSVLRSLRDELNARKTRKD